MPTLTSPRQPRLLQRAEPVASSPDESWLKSDIQAWLDEKQVDYSSSATKAELLALAEEE